MAPIHEPTLAIDGVLRPTCVRVDMGRIAANFRAVQASVERPVMAVLKANAYGHGLVPVARLFEQLGANYLGLAYLEEGIRLRQEGITTPILVLGGIIGSQIPLFLEHGLTLTASSIDKLQAIERCASSMGTMAKVHLKIDTGMERIGIHWYNAHRLLEATLHTKHVQVEGIFSHFSDSDSANLDNARTQLARFQEVCGWYGQRGLATPMRHMANSGGVLQLPGSWLDMVRPGILLFGVYPSASAQRTILVQPALSWHSRVVYFKVVPAGRPVSYGGTWAPKADTRVVTVPVGYGDGYFRSLSNKAEVLIHGRRYPVVGRVCMDQLLVDIGRDSAWNGDEVVLLGAGPAPSAEELAHWANTIPYEVLTNINTRVPRTYENQVAAPDENGQL
jgi:alanine racemase